MTAARLVGFSGRDLIKKFQKLGYEIVRQTGSHVRLRHCSDDLSFPPITVPLHKEMGIGLVRNLIREVRIEVDDFIDL